MEPDLAAEFARSCAERLDLDADTAELARKIVERCRTAITETCSPTQATQDEESKRLWFACILFIAKGLRQAPKPDGPRLPPNATVSLAQILEAFDISLPDFLKELPVAIKRAEPNLALLFGDDPPLERRLALRELQTAYVYTTVLAKKCKDLFHRFCSLSTGSSEAPSPVFRLLWLLFVLAKAELLKEVPELVNYFNLLVCVVNVILNHVPKALGAVDFTDTSKFPVRTESGAADTLASLALVSKANIKEMRPLAVQLDMLMQELLGGVVTADPNFKFPDGKVEPHRTGFPGLLGDPGTEEAIQVLEARYEQVYRSFGEIDERPFLRRRESDATPFVPGSTPPSMTKCQVATPVRSNSLSGHSMAGTPLRLLPSPLRPANHMLKTPSPVRIGASSYFATPGGIPGTPVTEAMASSAWLKEMSVKTSAQPSATLQGYFKGCDEDVTPEILKRVQELSNAIFPPPQVPSGVGFQQLSVYRERRLEGIKLYYKVLENMLKAEEMRTGKRNFTRLLSSDNFHKCLLACSFEMVVASYRMVTLTFPAVLERLQLKAFDLCKLIESFVRHEPTLPRELKRHLFNIEEKMLEFLAWERGSSIYPKLYMACPREETDEDAAEEQPAQPGVATPGVVSMPSASTSGSLAEAGKEAPVAAGEGSPPQEPTGNAAQERTSGHSTPSKRSLEGSPDTSPPKLQKGLNENKITPAAGQSPESPQAGPLESAAAPMDMNASPMPSGTMRSGLLSPKRQSETSAFSAFMSPLRSSGSGGSVDVSQLGPLPSAFGDPQEELDRPQRAVLADFLRKVLKLGWLRLADLCERMDFDPLDRQDILIQVYTMVQHVIYDHTHLLYNRHLDQILLSALYGVCKVNSLKLISFKEIIQHYKKQPQAKTDIFRTVVITQSDPELLVSKTGDIIEFYNAIFIPTVKAFVLKLGSRKAQLVRPPPLGVGARRTLMSPARASAPGKNAFSTPPAADRILGASPVGGKVFVSPLRQSPKQLFLATPRSRMIFAGRMGESAHAYQSPSKDLKIINSRIAAHSQHPVAPPIAPPAPAPAAAPSNQVSASGPQGTSSDHSCSTGRSSGGGDPSHSNSRYSEPSSSGRLARQNSVANGQAQPAGRGPLFGLDMMAIAAAQNGPPAQSVQLPPGPASRLEELHNAAVMVANGATGSGGADLTQEGELPAGISTRRTRRSTAAAT